MEQSKENTLCVMPGPWGRCYRRVGLVLNVETVLLLAQLLAKAKKVLLHARLSVVIEEESFRFSFNK